MDQRDERYIGAKAVTVLEIKDAAIKSRDRDIEALKARIRELEAERDQWKQAAERVVKESLTTEKAENPLLRKALEEIVEASRYAGWAASEKIGILAKAALARIPAANAL